MRWENLPESGNVEDRRGRGGMGGGGGGLMLGGAGGLLLFAVVMVAGLYGIDLTPILGGGGGIIPGGGGGLGGGITTQSAPYEPTAEDQDMARFTSVALKTTEDTWGGIFQRMGRSYSPPRLVMYSGVTQTGCGYGQSAMGPFYCPDDQTVYIDLSFYKDMQAKMGGGGDFAQGYVLSHEVGHHIQHLLGIDQQVMRLRERASPAESNRLSVMMELQADCYAGIWGKAMEKAGILEEGDLEEALRTAEAIGDDRLQRQSMGRVVPDSFTHGSSQQRYYWFKRGFDSGDPGQCNTFASAAGRD